MNVLTAGTAPVFQIHGVTFRSFVSSATRASTLAAWPADFSPRTPGQPHSMTEEEVLYVINGSLAVEIDGNRSTAITGEAVLVPAGAVFRVSNETDETAAAWVTTRIGMTAKMHPGGEPLRPPWAQ